MVNNIPKKIVKKIKTDNENGARVAVIEDLFYDFHRNRFQVYWMNFVRGLFFGFGSAIGATVIVAAIIWILANIAGLFPSIGDYIQQIIDAMQRTK